MTNILPRLCHRTQNPLGQFARYLIAGGIGAVIEIILFALLAWKAFPALREDEWAVRLFGLTVPPIDPAQRALNFAICMTITFLISNAAGYFLNAKWVFVPGRYSRRTEIIMFYSVALLSYLAGTYAGAHLITSMGTTGTTAYIAAAAIGILINYSFRKFVIFKG
jgi:putative flippase GtrA